MSSRVSSSVIAAMLSLFCMGICLPMSAMAQRGILSVEARLQVDHLESLEKVEKEQTARLTALNETFSGKLHALRDRLVELEKADEATQVEKELDRLKKKKPGIIERAGESEILNKFRVVYIRERDLINQDVQNQRTALIRDYTLAKQQLAVKKSGTPDAAVPDASSAAPVAANEAAAVAAAASDAPIPAKAAAKTGQPATEVRTMTATLDASGAERKYRVPDTDFIKILSTDPATPGRLPAGKSVAVRVAYGKKSPGRARIALYPFATLGPDRLVSRSRNIYAVGEGEITLHLQANGEAMIDTLRVAMTRASTGEQLTRDTESVRLGWFIVE